MIKLILFLIVLIIFLIFVLKKYDFFDTKTKYIIDDSIKADRVIINKNNYSTNFDNKIYKSFNNNTSGNEQQSDLTWKGVYNSPNKIFLNNVSLDEKDMSKINGNNMAELKFDDNLKVMNINYLPSDKGLWADVDIGKTNSTLDMLDINQTGSEDTEQLVDVGGEISDEIIKEKCLKLDPKNKFNKYYKNSSLKGSAYPGCSKSCCSPLVEPKKIVYDELKIGNTSINGEHLKLLKGQKMFSLKSESNNKCMSYPNDQINISKSWPNETRFLTNSDCVEYSIKDNLCTPDDTEKKETELKNDLKNINLMIEKHKKWLNDWKKVMEMLQYYGYKRSYVVKMININKTWINTLNERKRRVEYYLNKFNSEYINGTPEDAKNACNNSKDCAGFTYKIKNYDKNEWGFTTDKNKGSYSLKKHIVGTKSDTNNTSDKFLCYSKTDKFPNNTFYQFFPNDSLNVEITFPNKSTSFSKTEADIIQQNDQRLLNQQQSMQNNLQGYESANLNSMENKYDYVPLFKPLPPPCGVFDFDCWI